MSFVALVPKSECLIEFNEFSGVAELVKADMANDSAEHVFVED